MANVMRMTPATREAVPRDKSVAKGPASKIRVPVLSVVRQASVAKVNASSHVPAFPVRLDKTVSTANVGTIAAEALSALTDSHALMMSARKICVMTRSVELVAAV